MSRATRIHIFGASGSGTTTLGRAVTDRLDLRQFDADDYFWQGTEPPFTAPNPPDVRARLLASELDPRDRSAPRRARCLGSRTTRRWGHGARA